VGQFTSHLVQMKHPCGIWWFLQMCLFTSHLVQMKQLIKHYKTQHWNSVHIPLSSDETQAKV